MGGESNVRFTRFGSYGGAVKPGVVAVAGRPVVARARVWPGKSTGWVVGPLMVDSFSTSCIANPRTAAEAALAAHFAAALSSAGSVPVCTDVRSASIDCVTLWAIALKISFAASGFTAVAVVCAKVRGRASVVDRPNVAEVAPGGSPF